MTAVEDPDPADAEATVTLSAAAMGGYGSAEDVKVEITVADDEEATISVTDDFKNAEVVEGGALTYSITLSAPPVPDETVRVNLQVLGLARVEPAQAVFTSEDADNTIEVTVTTLHDSNDDDATFTIRHSVDADEDSGYKGATAPSNISVTVKDDEAAGVVVSRTSLSVEEGMHGHVHCKADQSAFNRRNGDDTLCRDGREPFYRVSGIRFYGSTDYHGDWPHGQQ